MAVDLNKRIEKVKIILAKKQLPDVKAQVAVAFDISGSMRGLYSNGTVQDAAERILALACRFDDNQNLDTWTFSGGADALNAITLENYATFVDSEILKNNRVSKWGGTNYFPVMNDIVTEYFADQPAANGISKLFGMFSSKKQAEPTPSDLYPSYAIIITDGENSDEDKTRALIEKNADKNIYWQFIGIGGTRFRFLEQIADQYPNVGLVTVNDLAAVSDDDLYMQLLNDEFCTWIRK